MIRLLLWGFGLIYVFSRFIPGHLVADYPSSKSVDDAWAQILHVAYVEHMQFGRDIVFTYGPWGFLARGYSPSTYLISVAAWFVLSLVFVGAGWRLTRFFTQSDGIAWVWLIGFAAVASLQAGYDIDNRLRAWGILLIFLHFFVEDGAFSWFQATLVFTLAWLGLVKFTGILEGALLVVIIALDSVIRYRRFPWIIPVWLAGILFFWLLAGQQAQLLWPFLKNSWAVVSGYTDAMNEGNLFALDPLLFVLIGTGFWVLSWMLLRRPRRVVGIFFGLGIGGILFLSFKHGYEGGDGIHEMTSAITLVLIGLVCLAMAVPTRKLSLISVVVFFVYASIALAANTFASQSFNLGQQLVESFGFDNLSAPIIGLTTDQLEAKYKKRLKLLSAAIPLPAVQGAADLYSCHQGAIFANGISYRPRPVIQSYSAYTPVLARMNSDWLRTDRAAPNLFFAVQPLGNRFPSLDDGLSWPELLTLYDIRVQSDPAGAYLWLTRSPNPREYQLEPLQETRAVLGKSFTMPVTASPVWAEIEIKKTFAGELLSFFYKPAVLMIDVKLSGGTNQLCCLVPGIARAGFLLSPYIADNQSFIALAQGNEPELASKTVITTTIYEGMRPGPPLCYEPQIIIRFYRLSFPTRTSGLMLPKNAPALGRIN